MAFLGGNPLPLDLDLKISIAGFSFVAISGLVLLKLLYKHRSKGKKAPGVFKTFLLFAYSCFIKPHGGDANATQQDSLESFYKNQAGIYDRTRKILLQGREDMLALLAAQLLARCETGKQEDIAKPTWVDVSCKN
jgi:betaine lipid synthase